MDSSNSMTLNIHLSPHPSYSRCHHGSILLKTDTTINENLMSVKHVTLIHTLKPKMSMYSTFILCEFIMKAICCILATCLCLNLLAGLVLYFETIKCCSLYCRIARLLHFRTVCTEAESPRQAFYHKDL